MSGIYGLAGNIDSQWLHEMGGRIAHRGAEGAEERVGNNVAFGQRLHSSPVCLRAENVALVADADLYNAEEVRALLEQRGHKFDTARPEEVILRGYLEFGTGICAHLHGDYAFALWDNAKSQLILARDPLGVRPLYYWVDHDRFAFASEYKALLAVPDIPARPDLSAIQTLQLTKFPPANRTLLQDIVSVPAGHFVVYHNGQCRQERFWDLALNITQRAEHEHVQSTRDRFLEAVRRRVRDLPVIGTTLSGGIDSAAVTAAARTVHPDAPMHTFTCGYGPEDPEMRSAEIVASAIGSTHHPIIIRPEAIPPLLNPLVWHLEDPIARSETVQIFETSRLAAQHVGVVLAGYAADGLYAGMPKHKLIRLVEQLPPLTTPVMEFYDYTQTSAIPTSLPGKLLHLAFYRGKDAPAPSVVGTSAQSLRTSLPGHRVELLNQVLRTGVVEGLPKWLPKADRLHMAYGLRFRSPFTDLDLIKDAFTIAGRWKIHGIKEKYVLRKAMQSLLPEAVLNRPKFPQAMNYDLAFSNVLEDTLQAILSTQVIQSRGFFRVDDIDRLRRRPAGKAYSLEQAMRLWTAMLTEIWAQIFVDRRGAPVASATSHEVYA